MSGTNQFRGKTVIVTGGGRGIGRAICVELYKLGAKVYAVSRNPDNLKALQSECPAIELVCVDLSDWDATRDAIDKIEPVDMLVNNAGVCIGSTFLKTTAQDFDAICSVNLKAVINVSQIVAKKMIDVGKAGSIVNISSVAGLKAMAQVCAYSTLKAGLDQLTKIMAIELGPLNIRVNSVNPGAVPTDMLANARVHLKTEAETTEFFDRFNQRIPTQNKIIDMENVVSSVLFLLSDSAPMITGTILAVDGGYCVT